jgi:hypothetical protein
MSKLHYDAALRCSQFTGITRLVLLIVANDCDDSGRCMLTLSEIMAEANCHRQKTISDALAELRVAGVMRKPNPYQTDRYVNWQWLHDHAMTPEQLAKFKYKSSTKGLLGDDLDDEPKAEQPKPTQKIKLTSIAEIKAWEERRNAMDAIQGLQEKYPDGDTAESAYPEDELV